MRAVVQRVDRARVDADGVHAGCIGKGMVVFVGFRSSDGAKEFGYMTDKLLGLRIFEDDNGKMNLSVLQSGGGVLLIPNFTLYGDARKGRRPDFMVSSDSTVAAGQFEEFCTYFRGLFPLLETGVFKTEMKVEVHNDGPVTILLDSERNF
ncbi:MAG: D-aminoacyl-tRNA deacylase [Saccharofermentanales bacterium]